MRLREGGGLEEEELEEVVGRWVEAEFGWMDRISGDVEENEKEGERRKGRKEEMKSRKKKEGRDIPWA